MTAFQVLLVIANVAVIALRIWEPWSPKPTPEPDWAMREAMDEVEGIAPEVTP